MPYPKMALAVGLLLISHAVQAEIVPGLPYEKMKTVDESGEEATYFVTHPDHLAPLVLFIQESGCVPLFEQTDDGGWTSELGLIISRAATDRVTLVGVDKPFTISYTQVPLHKEDTSVGCPEEYLRRDTLEFRLQQLQAGLRAAKHLPWVLPGPVLVAGRQDGAILAAMMARADPSITNVAMVNAGGAPKSWGLINQDIMKANRADLTKDIIINKENIINHIYDNGDSITNWYDDFPYKYWASVLRAFPTDDLLQSKAEVYVLEYFPASYTPIASREFLVAGLQARGRHPIVQRSLRHENTPSDENLHMEIADYTRIIDWFLAKHGMAQ